MPSAYRLNHLEPVPMLDAPYIEGSVEDLEMFLKHNGLAVPEELDPFEQPFWVADLLEIQLIERICQL